MKKIMWCIFTFIMLSITAYAADTKDTYISEKDYRSYIDERVFDILNISSEIVHSDIFVPGSTYTGNAFYVSSTGNDDFDGRSSENPWKTVDRVNREKLQPGDIILFERGGTWREELTCKPGVTYSAYGEGPKPQFFGSVENGSNTEFWELWSDNGEKKIWKYHVDMPDCGLIVFNEGEGYATRQNGRNLNGQFMSTKSKDIPYDIEQELEYDLQFAQYITFPDQNDMDPIGENYTFPVYLRCDSGNPADCFYSIEFSTAVRPGAGYCGIIKAPGNDKVGIVLDNLCIMYNNCMGISNHYASHMVIQNCEVAWVGGTPLMYPADGSKPLTAGEAIRAEGSYNTIRNCYIHDCFDGAVTFEVTPDMRQSTYTDNLVEKNVIERCMSGILIGSHLDAKYYMFDNFMIRNNDILFSGYGWGSNPNYDYGWRSESYDGTAINLWNTLVPNHGSMIFQGNTLYRATSSLIHAVFREKDYQPRLIGNTYIQDSAAAIVYAEETPGFASDLVEAEKIIYNQLFDAYATIELLR